MKQEIANRARKIKLLLMDCDGVLTDGRLYFSEKGEVLKVFHVRDGQGIAAWNKLGLKTGIISGRPLNLVRFRANELGIEYLKGQSSDKVQDLQSILQTAGILPEETAFIGDDLADIGAMKTVGLAVAVADAMPKTIEAAHYVTKLGGGLGAVRETIDLILLAKS